MNHDITHCTTDTCPLMQSCKRSIAWQEIAGKDMIVSAMSGEACQEGVNYPMYVYVAKHKTNENA